MAMFLAKCAFIRQVSLHNHPLNVFLLYHFLPIHQVSSSLAMPPLPPTLNQSCPHPPHYSSLISPIHCLVQKTGKPIQYRVSDSHCHLLVRRLTGQK